MTIIKTALLSLSFLAAICTMPSASAIVITDIAAPTTHFVTPTSPYTLTYNIVNDDFVVGTDTVTSGLFAFNLAISGTGGIDLFVATTNEFIFGISALTKDGYGAGVSGPLSLSALEDLNADGLLSFIVKAQESSLVTFTIDGSLAATVTKGQAVPEPTTVALLGLGLLGVAASRRKAANSKNA